MSPASGTPQMTVHMRSHDGTAAVIIEGELDLRTMPELEQSLRDTLAHRPERLVLDLAGVTFIDCASARALASASRALPGAGQAVIRRMSWPVARLLRLTGMSSYFRTAGSLHGCPPPRSGRGHEGRVARRAAGRLPSSPVPRPLPRRAGGRRCTPGPPG